MVRKALSKTFCPLIKLLGREHEVNFEPTGLKFFRELQELARRPAPARFRAGRMDNDE
jgi:hypothetical protein